MQLTLTIFFALPQNHIKYATLSHTTLQEEGLPASAAALAAVSAYYHPDILAFIFELYIYFTLLQNYIKYATLLHTTLQEGLPASAAALAAVNAYYHPDVLAFIFELFERFVDPMLAFLRAHCNEALPSSDINLVTSVAHVFAVCVFVCVFVG